MWREFVEQVLDLRVGRRAEGADRRQPLLGAAGEQPHRREAALHRGADLRVLLGGERLFAAARRHRPRGASAASCAAASRVAGSGLNRVSPPSAASIAPRSRLLTMMRSSSSGARSFSASPVAASVSLRRAAGRRRPARRGRPAHGAAGLGQRLQDRHGARVAELAERRDRLLLGGEAVAAEPGDRIAPTRPPAPAMPQERPARQRAGATSDARSSIPAKAGIHPCRLRCCRHRIQLRPRSSEPAQAWIPAFAGIARVGALPPAGRARRGAMYSASVRREFRGGAVAADPGIGPVGDLALVSGR